MEEAHIRTAAYELALLTPTEIIGLIVGMVDTITQDNSALSLFTIKKAVAECVKMRKEI